jgi:iron complex outermembrane receptor protein
LFGFDANYSWDDIAHLSIITMDPAKRLTHTVGFYVQDTITIVPDRSALVVGTKVEDNSFSGVEVAPSLRAVFTPDLRSTFWAAVSRAVRAPVRIDQDLVFGVGNTVILRASDDFKSETVLAYEFGYRTRIGNDLTFDLALFHNDYRDLRTTEPVGTAALPLTFKNTGRAKSDGAELSMVYIAKPNLSFNLSYRYLDLVFSKLPESRDTGDFSTEANDPRHLVSVGVRANLSDRVEFDAVVRHVSERPHPVTPPYTSADLRLAWEISSRWEISLSGRHLFAPKHRELVTGNSLNELIAPSATLKATWRY